MSYLSNLISSLLIASGISLDSIYFFRNFFIPNIPVTLLEISKIDAYVLADNVSERDKVVITNRL